MQRSIRTAILLLASILPLSVNVADQYQPGGRRQSAESPSASRHADIHVGDLVDQPDPQVFRSRFRLATALATKRR